MPLLMDWKAKAVVAGMTVVGGWFAGRPVVPPPAAAPTRSAAVAQAPPLASTIEEEARRLEARLSRAPGPAAPSTRNPFRFAPRGAAPTAPAVAAAATANETTEDASDPTPAVEHVAPAPPFRVIGVATEDIAGATVRTVILSGAQGAVFAQIGDTVTGGFRITTIDAAGVDMTSPDGVSRRLSLTP